MKHPPILRLLATLLLTLTASAASAYDFEVDGIYYNKNSDGTSVSVTYKDSNYNSYSGSVTIPSQVTHSGTPYSVTEIGRNAFIKCTGLTSVDIPNSVTEIGFSAFSDCSGLTSVTIGNSVTSIGNYAFSGCSGLKSVTIPNSVTEIGAGAFKYCSGLTSVTIGNSVTSIGNEAFKGCSGLTSITYNAKNCEVAQDWLTNCNSVSTFELGSDVETIPSHLCQGLSNLTSISIPNSVTSIGASAFFECSSLTSVTIPKSVTSIGTSAFANCSSLKSVVFGAGLTSIGSDAFSECRIKKAFWLPNTPPSGSSGVSATVHYVANDQYSFSNQTKYQFLSSMFTVDGTVYVPVSPSERTCDAVDCTYSPVDKDITIAETVSNKGVSMTVVTVMPYSHIDNQYIERASISHNGTIGNYAFQNCTALQSAAVSNVGSVGEYAFDGCTNLQELTLTNEGDVLEYAFRNTGSIANLTIANKGNLGAYAFKDSKLQNVIITNEGYVGECAFSGCTALQTATISNQGNIDNNAFQNCTALQSAAVSNVGSVGEYAFDGCTNLQELTLTNEGDVLQYAFQNTGSIANLTIANKGNLGAYAFRYSKLQNVTVANEGAAGERAFYNCTALQTATISNQGAVGASAFSGCSSLATVTLGEEVSSIDGYAFYNCSALGEIVIPDAVTAVGASAFEGCVALENVSIGKGVTSLPQRVFYGCSSLPSLTIPNNVASVADYAFRGCTALSDLTIEDAEESEPAEDEQQEERQQLSFDDWTSTNHDNSSTSYQEYSFTAAVGDVLTFNYSVSSESGYDFLIIKLNGTQIVKESGTKSGSYRQEFTEAGSVTLYLSYTKDSSNSSGSDQATVTDIRVNDVQTVDSSVLTLGANGSSPLFADCPLDEVYIGRKLSYSKASSAGYSPFYRNTSLRAVEITDAETQIYDNEFYGCTNLQTLKIGNGVKTIGKWAFSGCSSMEYFSAGYEVESIGQEAFSDCTGLTSYYSYSMVPPTCGDQALDDINKWECTLYIPATSTDEYMAADQWKEFFYMSEMDAVLVAEIQLNCNEFVLAVGDTFQLTAEILPANVTDPTIVWSSSDETVATVDENGLVTGVAGGFATITVTSADGNAMATADVEVKINTGIEDVTVDGTADIEVYNAAGVKMGTSLHNLVPGVYFVRQGTKVTKVVVK